MNNQLQDTTTEDELFNLALSTWFIMYLHENKTNAHPGGLPNDFLSYGACALLVFDEVICDEDALAAEMKFKDHWLSSRLFYELQQDKILKTKKMSDFFRKRFADLLRNHKQHEESPSVDLVESARRIMNLELGAIKRGERQPELLRIPADLTRLNHYMFMGLEIPSVFRYEWQENHFEAPRTVSPKRIQTEHQNVPELASVIKALLPRFELLPSPDDAEKAMLRENIVKEKSALYRWIYGDPEMPRDKYHDFRMSPDFTNLDKKIDKRREPIALTNLETLRIVRDKTKDVRRAWQKSIADVMNEKRTIADVQKELLEQKDELLSYVPNQRSTKVNYILASVSLALAFASYLSNFAGPVGSTLLTTSGAGLSAYQYWLARSDNEKLAESRRKYPLAWFTKDFSEIQDKQLRKLTPKKYRKSK